ncbi:hypothetical protein [Spartinivicinus poritis]|uniref:Uncharacterized protein n=1 Tax=Spartinivicinus poritis TaxID=2994640 RepID=A0ABT5U5Z9_9GAMM|nr:hypothetical protein [Spartinivicinus sp. A2-2]MDE1461780.1 hypothetical protein [Spartinivicinus sp. A2-2]
MLVRRFCLSAVFSFLLTPAFASEVGQPASEGLWESLQKTADDFVTDVHQKTTEQLSVAKEKLKQVNTSKDQQLEQLLATLDQNMQVIEKAGFKLTDLYLQMSLVPVVTGKFAQVRELTEKEWQQLLEEVKDELVISQILKSLRKAYAVELDNYKVADVRIEATIPPRTVVHFQHKSYQKEDDL